MELDARKLADGHLLETDLCIVGAGPAGIVLAREFIGCDVRVTLLESGGREPDPPTQELNEGTIVGDPYANPRLTRHRQAGGTVHLWNTPVGAEMGAKYVPLDAIDFEERPWIPLSGWPFDRSHLKPFYRRAQTVCGLGPFEYSAKGWTDADHPVLPLAGDYLTTKVYQFGLARIFTEAYLHEIRQSSNVSICYRANVTALDTDPAGERVVEARAVCLSGTRFRVRAKVFVLAAGAIENARLLLLSDEHCPGGLGNRHDWVGRCFMEHPRDYSLTWIPAGSQLFDEAAFYDVHPASGGVVMGRLALREEAMRSDQLLNMSATLLPAMASKASALAAALRLSRLWRWRHRQSYPQGGSGWSVVADKSRMFEGFRLLLNLEMMPNPENRIMLGRRRDALGRPKVEIHWRWGALDEGNLERRRAIVARELERSSLGRVEIAPGVRPDPNAHHHAGTTRMHSDPRQGVVDRNGRVHGIENLYLTGSSLFPTAGFANPTLTIVALALRLADDLKDGRA